MEDVSVTRFWDNYIDKTTRYVKSPKVSEWYVRHVEQYIRAYPDKRLLLHTAADLERYLKAKGRKKDLKDWVFIQIIYSLKILFVD